MRTFLLAAVAICAPAFGANAQRTDTLARDVVPTAVKRQVEARWNGPAALRAYDSVTVTNDSQPIPGNLAVQKGPLVIAGHVAGNVLAVNSDVVLQPGARIDGDLWVIGGRLNGKADGMVGGELLVYAPHLNARRVGDRMRIDEDNSHPREHPVISRDRATDLTFLSPAGVYNRVEGFPLNLGPSIREFLPWGTVHIDAFAIIRTGSTFESDHGDVGHDLSTEFRVGHRSGFSVGGRLSNTMDPVEEWQLSKLETSLSAFLFRRDYRDYYANHAASMFGRIYFNRDLSLTGSFADERWESRSRLNPFTIFRGDASWRANPTMDEGRLHIGNLTATFDTRTDPDRPKSGVYVVAEMEHGAGTLSSVAAASVPRTYAAGDAIAYNRGFIDARSYNRLSPIGQISIRVVAGGWLSGDQLPLERRLSVEGPSVLPGFDFRDFRNTFDTGTCTFGAPTGRPAECDRVALAQVEYRGNLRFDIGDWREDSGRYVGASSDASWILFADAGRGWLVGTESGDSTYPDDKLPPTGTFRTDLGAGFDFGGIGIYAAKALSDASEPMNFFLRLHRRF